MTWGSSSGRFGYRPPLEFSPFANPCNPDEGKVSGSQYGRCKGDHEYEREMKEWVFNNKLAVSGIFIQAN